MPKRSKDRTNVQVSSERKPEFWRNKQPGSYFKQVYYDFFLLFYCLQKREVPVTLDLTILDLKVLHLPKLVAKTPTETLMEDTNIFSMKF